MANATGAPKRPVPPGVEPVGTRAWHRWFLLIAGLPGVVLVFLVPIGKPPDEIAHIDRIWSIAHGRVVDDVRPDGSAGARIPNCLLTYENRLLPTYASVEPLHLREVWAINARCPDGSRPSTYVTFGNTAVNSPVTYAPQAVTVAALDASGVALNATFYGGRLAALAAYLALVSFSLWIAPRGRRILFVVGALPAALGLASTLSSDTMVLGLAIAAVALVLRLRFPGDDPSGGDRLARGALAVVLLALALAKNSSAPFLLLWLLVPVMPAVGSVRRWVSRLWVPVLGLALAGLWAVQVREISKFPPSRVIPGIDPQQQISWVAHHPLGFAGVLWRTVGSWEFFGGILPRVLGRYPSGRPDISGAVHSPPVPPWMLGLMVLALVGAVVVEFGAARGSRARGTSLLVGAVASVCALLVFLLVYSVASPVAGPRLLLLQGRYFTPFLSLAAIVVVQHRVARAPDDAVVLWVDRALLLVVPAVLVGELFVTYTMYFR